MFHSDEKEEAPMTAIPLPTESSVPMAPFNEPTMFEPSPPQPKRKASARPPKHTGFNHNFNPHGRSKGSLPRALSPSTSAPLSLNLFPTTISTPGNMAGQVEVLLERVHNLAISSTPHKEDQGEAPALHELMRALDQIIQGDQCPDGLEQPSTEVANHVYRLLIKKEKQKAYDSLVSIQTQIYDMQDKESGILSRSFEKDAERTIDVKRSTLQGEFQNFTFAPKDSLSRSGSAKDCRVNRNPIASTQTGPAELEQSEVGPKLTPCYLSDSEIKPSPFKSQTASQQSFLPPKSIRKRDSVPDIYAAQENARSYLYSEPTCQITQSRVDLASQSQFNDKATQQSSHRSLQAWNVRPNSVKNLMAAPSQRSGGHLQIHTGGLSQSNCSQAVINPGVPLSTISPAHGFVAQKLQSNPNLEVPLMQQQTDSFRIFEEIIILQKSQGFQKRCEKYQNLKRLQKLGHLPNHLSFGEDINMDLEPVKSARKLPRFTFNPAEVEYSTGSSDEGGLSGQDRSGRSSRQRAFDSSKALMTAFYVKKLLQKSLASLLRHPKERKAKVALQEMAVEKHSKVLQLIALNRIKQHFANHRGHCKDKLIADAFFRARIGRIYLRQWRHRADQLREEWVMLTTASSTLRSCKLQRLFKTWRTTFLQRKMHAVQTSTAFRIYSQNTTAKAFGALCSFARYSIRAKYLDHKSQSANGSRLKFKAFKSWQRFLLMKTEKLDMCSLALSLRNLSLQRQAFVQFRSFLVMAEHRRNVLSCANEYRRICLLRTGVRSLRQYTAQKKGDYIQRANVRAFYHTRLKMKLINFLHESNLEFIKRQVEVEEYMQRRKKLRNIMRVLYKHARLQKQQGCFTKLPSPKALYMAHLWLAPKSAPVFSFATVTKAVHHQGTRYREKQRNADLLLHTHVFKKVFRAWKRHSRKVTSLRRRIHLRLLARVVDAWYSSSQLDGLLRRKAKQIRGRSEMQTKIRLFRALKVHTLAKRRDHRLSRTVQRRKLLFTLRQTFSVWFNQYADLDKKRQQKHLSEKLKRKHYFKQYLQVWATKYALKQKKRSLLARKETFEAEFRKRKYLAQWLFYFSTNKALLMKGQLVGQAQNLSIIKRAFQALRGYKELKLRARFINEAMVAQYSNSVLLKCFAAWKKHAPEMQIKTALVSELDKDYRLKLLSSVLKALRLNQQFRQERKQSDRVMTKAITEISMRKFFKGWRSLTGKRLGLLMFAETFEKLRVAAFFKRGRRKIQFEDQVRDHMGLTNEFLLIQKAFNALRLQRQRRDLDQAKTASFQTLRHLLSLRQTMRVWTERFQHARSRHEVITHAQGHLENALLARCFHALKDNQERSSKLKAFTEKLGYHNLRKVFSEFRRVTVMYQVAAEMANDRDLATKASVLNIWRLELHERLTIKDLVLRKNFSLAVKAFSALRQNARVQRHRRFLIDQGQAINSLFLTKRVFFALSTHANTQQNNRHVIEQVGELMATNRQRTALRSFYQATINRKIHEMVFQQISLRVNRRVAADYLTQMRNQSKRRLLAYKACHLLHSVRNKVTLGQSLLRWNSIVAFDKQVQQITHEFDLYRRTQLLRLTYKTLKSSAKQKRAKRNLLAALLEKSVLMRKQVIFRALGSKARAEKTNRLNKRIAMTYRYDRTSRQCIDALRSHALVARRSKCLLGAAMFQRLVPKAFACLQMHRKVRIVKREMTLRATQVYQEKIQNKVMFALKQNTSAKRESQVKKRIAEIFYKHQVCKRALGRLLVGVRVLKTTNAKRNKLFSAVRSWADDITVKTCFNWLKQAIQVQKSDRAQRSIVFRRQKMARIFTAWQGSKLYDQKLEQLQHEVAMKSQLNTMRDFFTQIQTAYEYEQRIKSHQIARGQKTLLKCFNSFRLAKNLRKATHFARLWRGESLKRAFFRALVNQIETKCSHAEAVAEMRATLDQRLKTRVLLAFKYHIICQNSQRMIRQKLDRMLLVKSFDAFKYFCLSQRIVTNYVSFRDAKIREGTFKQWRSRFTARQAQKAKMTPLLQGLLKTNRGTAFAHWRKTVFRQKLHSTLQQAILIPSQTATVRACIQAWRKYAKFAKNKDFLANEVSLLCEHNTKRRFFTEWFNTAMTSAPVTLLCTKLQRVQKRVLLRSAFEKVLIMAVKRQQENAMADQFLQGLTVKRVVQSFGQLKRISRLGRLAKRVKAGQEQRQKASYLNKWINAYDGAVEAKHMEAQELEALAHAGEFYNEKVVKKGLKGFVMNLLESRKLGQATAYYLERLQRHTLNKLIVFADEERARGSLNRKALLFRQEHASSTSAHEKCYIQWRQRFLRRQQVRHIALSFQGYRSERWLSLVLASWKHFTRERRERNLRLGKIAATVSRRQARRIRIESFAAIVKAARIKQEQRLEEKLALVKAAKYHSDRIQGQVFDAWALQSKRQSETERRSRMYSLFSAWKFYAKERSLLKRYLFECGDSIGDVSEMTTLQLRDAANKRRDQSKSNMTDMSGSALLQNTSAVAEQNPYYDASQVNTSYISDSNVKSVIREHLSANLQLRRSPAAAASIPPRQPTAVNTPNFMHQSMHSVVGASDPRKRLMSPDVVLGSTNQTTKNEIRSAEVTSSRKKSSSVMSILRQQFGPKQEQN